VETAKSFGQILDQAGELLRGLSLRQRLLLAGGAVLVAATLWIFVGLMGKPKFVTLYSGLRAEEAQSLAARLAAKDIAYQLSPDGSTLLVPEEKLDASRLETAAQGLPRNARLGFELFDSPNWAGSDFTEKVNYQRALEGELERTLQTLSEVEAARVHLVLPRESLFSEQASAAKAAVILKTRGGRLSEQAQHAIPQLVASAVEGLRPENVTVVDSDSNTPLLRAHGPDGMLAYDLDEELAKTVVRTLEPVAGGGHVRASVHVEYDLSSSDNTDEIYDPKATATLSAQKSDEVMGGPAPAGAPGTASNLPGGNAPAVTLGPETQNAHSESATYAVSKTTRHVTQPPGRLKRIAAAVLVDDAVETAEGGQSTRRKRTADEMKQFEQLAGAALGIDSQRGDVLSVQNLSFQQEPAETVPPLTRVEKTRQTIREWSWLLRYVGIGLLFLIVYFLILGPVKKQVIASLRELPQRVRKAPLPAGNVPPAGAEIELPPTSAGAQRAQTLKRQLTEKIKSEPAVASQLVQTWIREDGK
jgi:flagellar M-ring protein FliF